MCLKRKETIEKCAKTIDNGLCTEKVWESLLKAKKVCFQLRTNAKLWNSTQIMHRYEKSVKVHESMRKYLKENKFYFVLSDLFCV